MKRPRLLVVTLVSLVYATSASGVAAGNAYNGPTSAIVWNIPNYGNTEVCKFVGIENIAKNTGRATSHVNDTVPPYTHCGPARVLGVGYLGVYVSGYRDGAYCGTTGWRYTTQQTNSFQIWSYLCTNPAGVQNFNSVAYVAVWTGSGYAGSTSISSPNQGF
jgi:hypothetical protein